MTLEPAEALLLEELEGLDADRCPARGRSAGEPRRRL